MLCRSARCGRLMQLKPMQNRAPFGRRLTKPTLDIPEWQRFDVLEGLCVRQIREHAARVGVGFQSVGFNCFNRLYRFALDFALDERRAVEEMIREAAMRGTMNIACQIESEQTMSTLRSWGVRLFEAKFERL